MPLCNMEEEFKLFLTRKEITVDEYKGGSLEAKSKLVEAFEKTKVQGYYPPLSLCKLFF
jgi:hypothetical protein